MNFNFAADLLRKKAELEEQLFNVQQDKEDLIEENAFLKLDLEGLQKKYDAQIKLISTLIERC